MKPTRMESFMSRIRNGKGFTLVEMAIVLVIIGIILGAVIKGQDLISNAKSKNISTVMANWKALVYTFSDRNSRLPGDNARTGLINGSTTGNEALFQLYSSMSNAPVNPVIIGGASYWVYLGNDASKNVMLVCNNAKCDAAFSNDDIEIFKAVDASIDGSADGTAGNFRAYNATVASLSGAPSLGFHGDIAKLTFASTISGSAPAQANLVILPASLGAWTGGTTKAAVYYFDKSL